MSKSSQRKKRALRKDDPAQAGHDATVMTRRQIILVFIGLLAGVFLSSLDQTIVSTSMRTIADDLDGLTLQAWVATAYLVTSTIGTPIYGKLSDIFGRRPLFIAAILIFLVGSIAAGFADSMYQLAAFRAVQGLGAGGLMALPLAIMGDVLAPRERAKAQGYLLGVFGLSSVAGPILGGVFSSQTEILGTDGWRWVFLLNVPVALIALALVLRFLRLPHTPRAVRIDWWGAAAVVVALVPLLIVAEQGRDWGWGSFGAMLCYVLGAIGIVAFLQIEKRMGDDALIPLKLFRNQTFAMATVLGVFVGFGMFGSMLTAPLYLQLVNNSTPMASGLQMLPMLLGLMIASIVTGQVIGRTGRYGIFFRTGMAALAIGFLWLTFLTADKPPLWIMAGTFIIGLGLGQLLQTLTIASQNSVGPRDIGVATSSSTFFRSLGGTLGVAVLFSILFSRLPDAIEAAADEPIIKRSLVDAIAFDAQVRTNQANQAIIDLFDGGVGGTAVEDAFDSNSNFLLFADPRLTAPFREGFNDAAVTAYWVGFAVMVIGFAVSFFITTAPLRDKSGIDEAAENAALAQPEAEPQATSDLPARSAHPVRRIVFASVAGVAAVALLIASFVWGTSPQTSKPAITLSTIDDFGYSDELLRQFTAETGITVTLSRSTSDTAFTNFFQKIGTSGLADVVAVERGWMPDVIAKAESIEPVPASLEGRWLDWKAAAASDSTGALLAYGTDIRPQALCYRSDLFAAAGLPSERDAVAGLFPTWDAFFDIGAQYTAATGKTFVDSVNSVAVGMIGQIEFPFETPDGPIAADQNAAVLDVYSTVTERGIPISSVTRQGDWEWFEAMNDDEFAVVLCDEALRDVIEAGADDDDGETWDIANVFPGGGGDLGGNYLVVPKDGDNVAAATQLADWLTSPEVQRQAFINASRFPSDVSTLGDNEVTGRVNDFFSDAPYGQIDADRAEAVTFAYRGPRFARFELALRDAVERVFYEQQTPQESWDRWKTEVSTF